MATYGIDLGTTNSCVASVDDTGRAVVLQNAIGDDTTPSVVYFESADNVVVGRQAKESALLAPSLVVELVKRQMGQDVHYTFHGQDHTPESVSALILRELARAAQEKTGEEVRDVVITVPAYFGVLEREATRKAGEIAGLNVLDVLAEPVAAALAYQALGKAEGVRHLFVYDLGGGTFDTTVIRIDGDDIQVVCTDGNHQLGGADWDNKIIDFLLRGFTGQYPDLDPSGDEEFMQDLANSAEQLKRTMEITGRTLDTAREKGVDHFDDVLLVGGMTIMPVIARTLKERYGLEGRLQDPHLAVAKGAALFALMRKVKASLPEDGTDAQLDTAVQDIADQLGMPAEEVEAISRRRVATVVPRAFGIKCVDTDDPVWKTDRAKARRYISHLLTANPPLPADTEPETFYTVLDNQRTVVLEVWEQAGSIASEEQEHNTHIGEGTLRDLPPRPAGAPFKVVFHMTETGLRKVHGYEADSGSEVRFEIQIGRLDEAGTQEAAARVAGYDVTG